MTHFFNSKKVFVYGVVPVALAGVLLAMYFSGNIVLQRLVSPKLPPLPPDAWREFGLLETIQHLIIMGIAGVALAGAYVRRRYERAGFVVIACMSFFVLLEELDYGTHYRRFLVTECSTGWFDPVKSWPAPVINAIDLDAEPFSLHNQGDVNDFLKDTSNVVLGLGFVVFPLVATRIKNPWVRYLAPDRYAILTVACMLALRYITHGLGEWEKTAVAANPARELGSISKNLSEFRELNLYYLGLIYLVTLVFMRQSPMAAQGSPKAS